VKIKWILLLTLFISNICYSQELSLLVGKVEPIFNSKSSNGWQVDYLHDLYKYFALSASYINEGHLTDHKRDGLATQLWGHIPLFKRRVLLAIGGGAYYYFDTATKQNDNFENTHGLAQIYSVSATYYISSPWFVRLLVNRINHSHDVDANIYLLGIGCQLWHESKDNNVKKINKTGKEVMGFIGEAISNNLHNHSGIVGGLEFRTGIVRNLDWTFTWLCEDNPYISRNGLGSQLWIVDKFFNQRVDLGFGIGPYYFINQKYLPESERDNRNNIGALVSITTSYRFTNHWFTRFNWNRVLSRHDRDTDDFVLGLGYSWG